MGTWSAPVLVPVRDGSELEVLRGGSGEPVLLVQTALTADELRPVGERLAEHGPFTALLLHRRGYAGSSRSTGQASVGRDAHDCVDLLDGLDVGRAHLVGASYSAAVVLELASRRPDRVHTVTLVEPPPTLLPGHHAERGDFVAACERLLDEARERGSSHALETFATLLMGAGWRADLERDLPRAVAQVERDAATFFSDDLPALLGWRFGPDHAARVRCPVLHVGGTASGPWFARVREQVLAWFPGAEDRQVQGADHSLAVTHPDEVAGAISAFLRRHPLR